MKRFVRILSGFAVSVMLLIAPASAFADTFWQVDISTPATQHSRTFGVEYTVLATDAANFTVSLYQDGVEGIVATQNTSADPNAINGNSGDFSVTVPADGDYSYHITASRDGSTDAPQTTVSKSVHVDATAPDAPNYTGKTRTGNSYHLTFIAPSSPDVTHVQIFASTSQTFAAGDATRVGDVAVTPSQSASFNYTAPDSATRYFALQAFDAAGNGSAVVGDAGTVVTPVRFITASAAPGSGGGGGTAGITTASSIGNALGEALSNAATAGAANPAVSGQINATGTSNTSKNNTSSNNGKVLGAQISKPKTNHVAAWFYSGTGLLALLIVAYYFLVQRRRQP